MVPCSPVASTGAFTPRSALRHGRVSGMHSISLTPSLTPSIPEGEAVSPQPTPTKLCVFGSIEAIRTKENKGLKQVHWRKSLGGTPLRDPSLTRLGSGDMQVSLAQALTRMRSDVASPSSTYSADSPSP